jgi:hypothetical protein
MIYSYKEAKSLIEAADGWLDKGLLGFLCERRGYQVQEHRRFRWNLAMRQSGMGGWQSLPDFEDFDATRRFLLDERTRVLMLQESQPELRHRLRPWRVKLDRPRLMSERHQGIREDGGSGYGGCPAYALAAAWLDLEMNRSRQPAPPRNVEVSAPPMPETEMHHAD